MAHWLGHADALVSDGARALVKMNGSCVWHLDVDVIVPVQQQAVVTGLTEMMLSVFCL